MPTPTWKQRPPLSLSPSYGLIMCGLSYTGNIVYIKSRGTIEDKDLYDLPLRPRKRRKRILEDINEVLVMVKNDDYDGLCHLLRSNPYIQHWKLFEMAIRKDADRMYITTPKLTPDKSLSIKLVESGYKIIDGELDDMERELQDMKDESEDGDGAPLDEDIKHFRILHRWIIDNQLMRCKSLQELCRQRLRKQLPGDSYVALIEPLDYPQKLKDFLLKFP